ncbi:protein of unknown function [Candidatus Methylomirabilis oxygeniifera]|uniref:Uncharacterized protein n=1 Tax=Methylomirabilis oxygeniifera TaxID=671143 RepID=D5MIX1_METO1|nr:protein of unknown function [Candidatus Methylomirabilis oxyfera]
MTSGVRYGCLSSPLHTSSITPSRDQCVELPHTHRSLRVLLGGAPTVVIECDPDARLLL